MLLTVFPDVAVQAPKCPILNHQLLVQSDRERPTERSLLTVVVRVAAVMVKEDDAILLEQLLSSYAQTL